VVTLNTSLPDPSKCQQNITSTGLSRGRIISSAQTWPVLTTCSFRFQGRPNERVWVYFLKYHFASVTGARPLRRLSPSQPCHNHLEIHDIQPWVTSILLITKSRKFRKANKLHLAITLDQWTGYLFPLRCLLYNRSLRFLVQIRWRISFSRESWRIW